uniref:peripheral-type benzodiazepine receptor-associated protein 1-like n=1 Tax=Pristiophorus japonicus TaxID=55135 RepID=UPI00398E3614
MTKARQVSRKKPLKPIKVDEEQLAGWKDKKQADSSVVGAESENVSAGKPKTIAEHKAPTHQPAIRLSASGAPLPQQLRNEFQPLHRPTPQDDTQRLRQLEEKNRALKAQITTLNQDKQQATLLETELNRKRKECESLGEEVQKKQRRCQSLVKVDYEHLKEALPVVTRERDLAVQEKDKLRVKLENLEQVLKHMREAAGRRQQLELEHVEALAVLNTKQQEIEVLQKAQVEAKKEHEGAVQLLEATEVYAGALEAELNLVVDVCPC